MRIQSVDLLLCFAFTAYEYDYDMKNRFNLSNRELKYFYVSFKEQERLK